MGKQAHKVAVIESESGWGRKIDDWMVCLTPEDTLLFKEEFNSKNDSEVVPDWYMVVEGDPDIIELSDVQYVYLKEKSRVWLSELKLIK